MGTGRRSRRRVLVALAALGLVAACSSDPGETDEDRAASRSSSLASVPAEARAIMGKPAYRGARWVYQFSDAETGEVLAAHRPAELAFTGSTAKLFTVGTLYDSLGANHRITTPVYGTGTRRGGVLRGDLVLVGAGDLTLGGRNAARDRADDSFTADTIDHVYGDLAPNAAKPPGRPTAGLDDLARQVAAAGIRRVQGDVVVDDRLWRPFEGQEGAVTPVFVNDNILDITVTPGSRGTAARAVASPRTAAYRVVSQVRTTSGSDAELTVEAGPQDPRRLVVSGSIGEEAGQRLTIHRVQDPARWARTLFVEALDRAGVGVDADPRGPNPSDRLPRRGGYRATDRVASFRSPPVSAFGSLILKTSYNTGANAVLCLLAVDRGERDCTDGLAPIRRVVERARLEPDDVVLVDGQGADPASTSPAQLVRYLRWTRTRPWARAFAAGQPVLGESGSLAGNGADGPARGKVAAKTGTSAHPDPGTGRVLFNVQSLAGFMTTDDGRTVVFDLAMSGGTYPDLGTALSQSGRDVAGVAAAFQQALP